MPSSNYASRAGEKLELALQEFGVSVEGLVCADFGSSSGGFVSCLLQNGAKKVYAVDTAYGELAWELRNDPRVAVLERTNALYVRLPEEADLVTIDLGWTRQGLSLPSAFANLKVGGRIISLIKPHYEAPAAYLRKGRLLPEYVGEVLEKVDSEIIRAGGRVEKIIESPLLGEKGGNREFLALITRADNPT